MSKQLVITDELREELIKDGWQPPMWVNAATETIHFVPMKIGRDWYRLFEKECAALTVNNNTPLPMSDYLEAAKRAAGIEE